VAGKLHLAQGTDDPVQAEDLVRLIEEGEAFRVRAMRHDFFLLARKDLPDYLGAFGWTDGEAVEEYGRLGIEKAEAHRLETAVFDAVPREGGTATEIRRGLDPGLLGMVKGRGTRTPRSTLSVALEVLGRRGQLVIHRDASLVDLLPLEYNSAMREVVKPNRYFRLDRQLPSRLRRTARDRARDRVLRRFVRQYGPVTAHNIATWTGFRMEEVRAIVRRLGRALREVRLARIPGPYLMDEEDELDGVGADEITFLPVGDSYPMGMENCPRQAPKRDWLIARAWPTVFVGGELAGVWRYSRLGRTFRLIVTPLPRWGNEAKGPIGEAAIRVSRHLAPGTEVSVGWAPELYAKLRPQFAPT
jgi:hypothetical protein